MGSIEFKHLNPQLFFSVMNILMYKTFSTRNVLNVTSMKNIRVEILCTEIKDKEGLRRWVSCVKLNSYVSIIDLLCMYNNNILKISNFNIEGVIRNNTCVDKWHMPNDMWWIMAVCGRQWNYIGEVKILTKCMRNLD